ncbi:MAG: hypothetical protein D6820_05535 [Lentisphaerae bacterium]|nr:MAG: hypothetical protein D6820_05535 [Lentisphaerota bacterium]
MRLKPVATVLVLLAAQFQYARAVDHLEIKDLGKQQVGNFVSATVHLPGVVVSGAVTHNGGWPWSGGPATFTAVVPGGPAATHQAQFDGTYRKEGGKEGDRLLTWRMLVHAEKAGCDGHWEKTATNVTGTSSISESESDSWGAPDGLSVTAVKTEEYQYEWRCSKHHNMCPPSPRQILFGFSGTASISLSGALKPVFGANGSIRGSVNVSGSVYLKNGHMSSKMIELQTPETMTGRIAMAITKIDVDEDGKTSVKGVVTTSKPEGKFEVSGGDCYEASRKSPETPEGTFGGDVSYSANIAGQVKLINTGDARQYGSSLTQRVTATGTVYRGTISVNVNSDITSHPQ